MITHVVVFKFKDENKDANIEAAIARLESMRGNVPSLGELEVGRHEAPMARSLDLALITRFVDAAALAAYADHPFHVEVKKFLAGVLETSYVVDFSSPAR